MKFAAACSLALVASASAFAPAPDASVSDPKDILVESQSSLIVLEGLEGTNT